MSNKSFSKFGVEEIVARMRMGVRRRVDHATYRREEIPGSVLSDNHGSPSLDLKPIVLQPSFQPRVDDHYHVNDLLQYHDRAFIQNAYRAILRRGPDATGFSDFIEALRSGRMNKIDVLARLRYSTEGRAKSVTIDGLFLPASVRLLYRVPLVGYLMNLVIAIARLPNSLRHEQQFQAHVLAQQEIITEHANHLVETIGSFGNEMARSLSRSIQELTDAQRQQIETVSNQHHVLGDELRRRLAQTNDRFEQTIAERDSAESRLTHLNQHFESVLVSEQTARERDFDRLTTALTNEQSSREENFRSLLQRIGEEASRLRNEMATVEQRLSNLSDTRQGQTNLLANELKAEIQKLVRRQQEARAEVVLQGERVTRLLDDFSRRRSGPIESTELATITADIDHALDALYLSLEDQFRGSRADIKQRLRAYLPWIERAGPGREQLPLLDVGCGRGEWLELMREEGLKASGVDVNRVLVQQCRENNLEVTEADLISHLRSLRAASLGGITAFHVIEHLPIEVLVKFLDETVRVLKPGGLIICETPNPQNVLVGTCNFYFDPTHRNPLPSPITQFLLESRGFTDVQVLNLNPSDEAPVAGDSELVRRFNQYFYGPMDYAVVGWRP